MWPLYTFDPSKKAPKRGGHAALDITKQIQGGGGFNASSIRALFKGPDMRPKLN